DRAGRDHHRASYRPDQPLRDRGGEGEEPPRAGGSRRPGPAHLRAAGRLLRPALPALLRRAHPRRRRHDRLRRRHRRRRPDERPLPQRCRDRLRRHHREAGLHHRQPQRDRVLRLRRLVPL
ncbi:MAG: Iron-sulfur cluster insertion protein SCO2161, partial [uncultured Nocardioides sp.]